MTITKQFTSVNTSTPNSGEGDDLRTAFTTVNSNFEFMSNTGFNSGNIIVSGDVSTTTATVSGNLIVGQTYVPTSNTAGGTVGQVVWDSGNIYVCVATNTWKRAALTSTF